MTDEWITLIPEDGFEIFELGLRRRFELPSECFHVFVPPWFPPDHQVNVKIVEQFASVG